MSELSLSMIKTFGPIGIGLFIALFTYLAKHFKAFKKVKVFNAVSKFMQKAEDLFSDGKLKKEWVISQCKVLGLNEKLVSDTIEKLIEFSKNINK